MSDTPVLKAGDVIALEIAAMQDREKAAKFNDELIGFFFKYGITLGVTVETPNAKANIVAIIRQ